MRKVEDKRFAQCNDTEENIKIYKDAVRQICEKPDCSKKEKEERRELEKLLVFYRADLSSYVPKIMSKPLVPTLMLKFQEKRLNELIKKYDDPQKLNRSYKQSLKKGIVEAFSPVAQIELFKFKLVQNKEYQAKVTAEVDNLCKELNLAITEADRTIKEDIAQVQKKNNQKEGLTSYLIPEKGNELENSLNAKNSAGEKVADSIKTINGRTEQEQEK